MEYRLAFSGPIKPVPGNALRAAVSGAFAREDFGSLTLIFSTEGGDTREGIALYNFFRSLPHPVRMHAGGHVDSMGVVVYLAGHERTCSPASRFFFHPFAWTFDSSQSLDGMNQVSIRFRNDVEAARKIVRQRSNMPPAMARRLYGRGSRAVVVEPERALEWGIAQKILELNPEGNTQRDVTLWTVTW